MSRPTSVVLAVAAMCLPAVQPVFSQSVISAKSGLIHYAQGAVYVGDAAVITKAGQFPQINEKQELRTEAGRAEVLLSPGVFLRVGEDSSFRMVDTRLTNSRLDFLRGRILLEAAELGKGELVTVMYKDTTVSLLKEGLYRFDSEPAELRVFSGEALVESSGQRVVVGKGKLLPFDGTLVVQKFDRERTDPFDRWSGRRAEQLAVANVYAARSIRDNGVAWRSSGWYFNPYFGLFTFVPLGGNYLSPYGYSFWSPSRVYMVYAPQQSRPSPGGGGWHDANRGYTVMAPTMTGNSGVLARGSSGASSSAPAPAAPSSSTAPISRDSGKGGSRSR